MDVEIVLRVLLDVAVRHRLLAQLSTIATQNNSALFQGSFLGTQLTTGFGWACHVTWNTDTTPQSVQRNHSSIERNDKGNGTGTEMDWK